MDIEMINAIGYVMLFIPFVIVVTGIMVIFAQSIMDDWRENPRQVLIISGIFAWIILATCLAVY